MCGKKSTLYEFGLEEFVRSTPEMNALCEFEVSVSERLCL